MTAGGGGGGVGGGGGAEEAITTGCLEDRWTVDTGHLV